MAFRNWNAARRLVERGATATLWQAAALGDLTRVRELAETEPAPGPGEVTNALWHACHGGQRPVVAYLLESGANINWVGHEGLTPLEAARRGAADELADWLSARGAVSADRRG
ncbi:ankyrin repeat domain-containing protein [Actinomadura syzygii]|uniref:ankyrin repeat domain-containing protein n=1 Tax=Actinomadura syzygii TaxID=1427538 RepID=UPI001CA319EB|nr:ankyrin repeat domain-containing protein [Actinomadura syzygii]